MALHVSRTTGSSSLRGLIRIEEIGNSSAIRHLRVVGFDYGFSVLGDDLFAFVIDGEVLFSRLIASPTCIAIRRASGQHPINVIRCGRVPRGLADNGRPGSGARQAQHDDDEKGRLGDVHGPSTWRHVDNSRLCPQILRIPSTLP